MRLRGLSGAIALTVLTVVAGACATTGIRPQAISLPTRQYTFPSGLRVVIEDDASARSMEAVWIVEAGFADDPPDQPGLAHAVEHIVFEIPEADGDSARHHLLDRGAVTANAETDLERTMFWVSGPCRQLDSLVATQVGWMAHPLSVGSDALVSNRPRPSPARTFARCTRALPTREDDPGGERRDSSGMGCASSFDDRGGDGSCCDCSALA